LFHFFFSANGPPGQHLASFFLYFTYLTNHKEIVFNMITEAYFTEEVAIAAKP
jgi:hypothetical protein